MRTVKLLGNCRIEIEDAPDPVPAKGEVLVRLTVSALCGSEFGAYRADKPFDGNAGHEAVGVVVDPNGTAGFTEGDRVGVYAPYGCGTCKWCARGMDSFCDHKSGTVNLHCELRALSERALLRLPDDVPFDAGVLLSGDGLGVPYHVSRRLMPTPGERVCVFGCGPIGLGNVQVQSYFGAAVVAVDLSPKRLELARSLGAAHAIDASSSDPIEALRELTAGEGVGKAIEASGSTTGFETALRCLGKAGRLMVVGGVRQATIQPISDLLQVDKTIMGSFYYLKNEFPEMVALYRAGFPVAKLITHRFALEHAAEAFELFAAGETGKVLLER